MDNHGSIIMSWGFNNVVLLPFLLTIYLSLLPLLLHCRRVSRLLFFRTSSSNYSNISEIKIDTVVSLAQKRILI